MKILLPVDGSKYTRRMLSYIAAHDELLGAGHQYLLVTVVPKLSLRAASFIDRDTLDAYYQEEADKVLRAPLLTNLRMDPFERAESEHAMGYQRWYVEHMWAFAPAGAFVANWLQSFKDFPPRQKPGSFNLDRVMEAVTSSSK